MVKILLLVMTLALALLLREQEILTPRFTLR